MKQTCCERGPQYRHDRPTRVPKHFYHPLCSYGIERRPETQREPERTHPGFVKKYENSKTANLPLFIHHRFGAYSEFTLKFHLRCIECCSNVARCIKCCVTCTVFCVQSARAIAATGTPHVRSRFCGIIDAVKEQGRRLHSGPISSSGFAPSRGDWTAVSHCRRRIWQNPGMSLPWVKGAAKCLSQSSILFLRNFPRMKLTTFPTLSDHKVCSLWHLFSWWIKAPDRRG